MKKVVKYIAPVVVLGLGVAVYALLDWARPVPEKKTGAPRALSVFVEPVEQSDVDLMVSASGEVRPRTAVDLVAQVAGRIASVSPDFVEGGVVQPGKTLITIEDTDYRLALPQARVRVAQAEKDLQQTLADADVARQQISHPEEASDLALKKPQVAEAQARLVAAKAELEQANLNLARTHISLPFSGRIISKAADVGQYVTPGTRLGRAFSTDTVEVRIPFSEAQLASLGLPVGYVADEGQGRTVDLSAKVAGQEQHWRGSLVRLDAVIDSETRMLYGIVRVDSPYDGNVSQYGMPLAVGMFVNAEIIGRRVEAAYVIPREALRAGNKVYVVDERGKLDIRNVKVTHSSSSEAIIAAGLASGEQVIVSSMRDPIEGMAVEAMKHSFDESAVADHHRPQSSGS